MLGKLFKQEWRSISKLLLVLHGFILIFAILSRIFFEASGGFDVATSAGAGKIVSVIAALLIFFTVLILFCAAMFTSVYIGYRFYKNVFTEQGYLTNTLPVTPTQIIVSKGLTGLLWTVIDLIVLAAALLIMFATGEFMSVLLPAFGRFFQYLSALPAFCWIFLIMLLLSPFLTILHLYFCVAVGSLVPNHKILGAIGVYIISYVAIQIFSTIVLALSGIGFGVANIDTTGMTGAEATYYLGNLLTPMFLIILLCEIIATLVCFFVTKYIMTKKLNLE